MAIKSYVSSAWEDIEDYKISVDGARESADYVRTYVDGAWENVWQKYNPIADFHITAPTGGSARITADGTNISGYIVAGEVDALGWVGINITDVPSTIETMSFKYSLTIEGNEYADGKLYARVFTSTDIIDLECVNVRGTSIGSGKSGTYVLETPINNVTDIIFYVEVTRYTDEYNVFNAENFWYINDITINDELYGGIYSNTVTG